MNKLIFSDYGEEGLFAFNLSKIDCKLPYLVCSLEFDEEGYRTFNIDTGEYEGDIWFIKYIEKLKEVAKFEVQVLKNHSHRYFIYKVMDKEAYLKIWSKASSDYRIAEITISGECDLDMVIDSIKNNRFYDNLKFDPKLVNWAYTQSYGGGSDEYYAVFYSKEKESVDFILKQINGSSKSNFIPQPQ
ncbi:MAG: hypothetical protein JKY19_08505 [Alcanivoracaceae bacterium]|nr:hypothetical protein [Alcanivoracaceae bacterium]